MRKSSWSDGVSGSDEMVDFVGLNILSSKMVKMFWQETIKDQANNFVIFKCDWDKKNGKF